MIGVCLGTGPSLHEAKDSIYALQEQGAIVGGVNNTFHDYTLDLWIACDPKWHEAFGRVSIANCRQYHWDKELCEKYGYEYIEGRWADGLSTDKSWISYNHSSSAQVLNLLVHFDCDPILLCGFDMSYSKGRHYFDDLSDMAGEYPAELRKHSGFSGLIKTYDKIAAQEGLPEIINCTENSALLSFPFADIKDFL